MLFTQSYINTQQSTDSPNPIGPWAYDSQDNVIYSIQYRGLGSAKFPAVFVYTLDVSNNISRSAEVPLLINWSGGK